MFRHQRKAKNLAGMTFGRLTALRRVGSHRNFATWLCACTCGGEIVTTSQELRAGDTRSCGCLRRETAARQGRLTPPPSRARRDTWKPAVGITEVWR
jgi:hypothetical protein